MSLVREHGPIEMLSEIGYVVVLIVMSAKGGWKFLKGHSDLIILVGALLLRELDFHERFTTMSITKSKFFFSAQVPLPEKAMACLVGLILLVSIISLIKKHFKSFLKDCTNKVVPMIVAISLLFMAISKSLDVLMRKLKNFDMEVASRIYPAAESLEEIVELGIPLILIVSTLAYFNKKAVRSRSDRRD